MALLEKLIAVFNEGSLVILIPLVMVCFGIGILTVERMFYLFGSRGFLAIFFPPARREVSRRRSAVTDAFDAYISKPTVRARDQLLAACARHETPFTKFLVRVVRARPNPETYELRVHHAVLSEEVEIEKRMQVLSVLAKAAPLMGLMGTVTGMIQTFSAMMVASTSDPKALSSGISVALIATNVGLVVALPGVISMSTLSRRAQTLLEEIRLASMQLRNNMSEFFESEGLR